jgi:putative thioredoxin
MAYIDVTDATFQTEVIDRSVQVPVVVDLWAEWCGPCKTLGPIIEKVVDATDGKVALAKVDVDSNPQVAQAFQVQSIPAVYALKDGKVVDGFIGAQPEQAVAAWVAELVPTEEQSRVRSLIDAGDEGSLREALELEPDNTEAITALAALLVDSGDPQGKVEALELIGRIPETPETRRIAAQARTENPGVPSDVESQLDTLLTRVRSDDDARQSYVDLLELMGPADPRTAEYRKKLSTALY